MARLICDTNIFYELGGGTLKLADLLQPGDTLHYSPIAVIEIAGSLEPSLLAGRRRAAWGIRESRAELLREPDAFLAHAFGYDAQPNQMNWPALAEALGRCETLYPATGRGAYVDNGSPRYVPLGEAVGARAQLAGDFMDGVAKLGDEALREAGTANPQFGAWLRTAGKRGKKPRLGGAKKDALRAWLRSTEAQTMALRRCWERARHGAKGLPKARTTAEETKRLDDALPAIECFSGVYRQYCNELITTDRTPEENDALDLEYFLYSVDDDHLVVTCEGKWERIAADAGWSHRVRRIHLP